MISEKELRALENTVAMLTRTIMKLEKAFGMVKIKPKFKLIKGEKTK